MSTREVVMEPVGLSRETVRPTPVQEEGKRKLSFEEFLAWCDEDTWAEWVDGEVEMLSPASTQHQRIADFLVKVLGIYVEGQGLGEIISAPFLMRLPDEMRRGREPDLIFVSREHLNRLKETFLDGPADVVVEIVSLESLARDRGTKFYEYELGGVREYWLIDPLRQQAEFYRLGEDGRYRVVPSGAAGVYHSEVVPGFWLRVEWLWQEPLPKVLDVLRELGVV